MKSTDTPPPGAVDVTALLDELDQAYATAAESPVGPTLRAADADFIVAAVNAVPKLTATLRAVLTKCDDMEAEAPIGRFFAVEFRRVITDAMSGATEAPRCKCSHARIQHRHGAERCYLAACGCASFRPERAA